MVREWSLCILRQPVQTRATCLKRVTRNCHHKTPAVLKLKTIIWRAGSRFLFCFSWPWADETPALLCCLEQQRTLITLHCSVLLWPIPESWRQVQRAEEQEMQRAWCPRPHSCWMLSTQPALQCCQISWLRRAPFAPSTLLALATNFPTMTWGKVKPDFSQRLSSAYLLLEPSSNRSDFSSSLHIWVCAGSSVCQSRPCVV